MAYADFTLTDFGAQWLAQSVQDAQDGTHKAVLVSMDFGKADSSTPPGMGTLWCSDSTSLAVWPGSSSIGIRGVASNLGDSTSHAFDFIQISGTLNGTPGVITYCQSAEEETIPPASVQQITRVATVTLALSGTASVTLSTPQIGYALESEVVKLSPAENVGGVKLSDGNGHTTTLDCSSAGALTISGAASVGGSLSVASQLSVFGAIIAAQSLTAVGDVSTSGDLTASGDAKASNLPAFAVFSRASLSDEYTGQIDGVTLTQESASTIFSEINSAASGRGIYVCVDEVNAAGVTPKCVPIAYAQTMSTSDFPLPSSVGGCVLVVRWR